MAQTVHLCALSDFALTQSRNLWRRPFAWWAWLAIDVLLLGGLAGSGTSRLAALMLVVAQTVIYLARTRSLLDFPTQVRVVYLVWMVASFVPHLTPMFWIQATGTTALVVFGYCPLARSLLFLPINRRVPLTPARALKIVLHPPTKGSVLDELAL